ncbi:MAG: 3-deoxy-7-phosphoheptulonate synthase [Firmicutes bacterium]|nr:3-deoxy-7-phosphoheptulonate synthase [Bacillota bacterium]
MVVVMKLQATETEVEKVQERLEQLGFTSYVIQGVERIVVAAVGDTKVAGPLGLEVLPGVEKVVPIMRPFKLVSREFQSDDTVVTVGGVQIGGSSVVVMAGPCAVETREQMLETAWAVKQAGAKILRGGAFKPRTSPYSFQGLAEEGLKLLAEAREETGMPIVTEVVSPEDVELVAQYADILQVGARNMQNFALLRQVGQISKPILLKRGPASTIDEWLMAAEYILSQGNTQVMLCERGIRNFDSYTRNTLDLSAVPVVKYLSHLPVIVDPSHGTGKWRWVGPMAKAALAAGCDGLMIEVHPRPAEAWSDGPQSLTPARFTYLVGELRSIAGVLQKQI